MILSHVIRMSLSLFFSKLSHGATRFMHSISIVYVVLGFLFYFIYLYLFKAVGTIFAFLFMPYKAWTNDHKCNTWSRQKLSPQRPSTPEEHSHKMMLKKKKKKTYFTFSNIILFILSTHFIIHLTSKFLLLIFIYDPIIYIYIYIYERKRIKYRIYYSQMLKYFRFI